jgi:micrococcal nuclease
MARDGYASPLTVPPNVAHETELVRAAAEAREAGRGLWSACAEGDDDVAGMAPTTAPARPAPPASQPSDDPATTAAGRSGCDPSYPDVCIPPAPPDLDCGDIPHRRFAVLPPDPHHFDGGGDGVGCEADG